MLLGIIDGDEQEGEVDITRLNEDDAMAEELQAIEELNDEGIEEQDDTARVLLSKPALVLLLDTSGMILVVEGGETVLDDDSIDICKLKERK